MKQRVAYLTSIVGIYGRAGTNMDVKESDVDWSYKRLEVVESHERLFPEWIHHIKGEQYTFIMQVIL